LRELFSRASPARAATLRRSRHWSPGFRVARAAVVPRTILGSSGLSRSLVISLRQLIFPAHAHPNATTAVSSSSQQIDAAGPSRPTRTWPDPIHPSTCCDPGKPDFEGRSAPGSRARRSPSRRRRAATRASSPTLIRLPPLKHARQSRLQIHRTCSVRSDPRPAVGEVSSRRLRHSRLTHLAEQGIQLPMLITKSRHTRGPAKIRVCR
jgi:hypothetical protein